MKKIIGLAVVLLFLLGSTVSANEGVWKPMEGGNAGEERAPFTVEDTQNGIRISGSGGYDMAGSAAGVILTKPVSYKKFSVELQMDQISGLRKDGADHWFAVNLLNQPKFFSLDQPGSSEGLNVFLRPYADGLLDVWVYGISGATGWVGIGGTVAEDPNDKVTWNNKTVKLEFYETAEGNQLIVNGTDIFGDYSMVSGKLFNNGEAYFSTGASNSGPEPFTYTVVSVNGSAVSLDGEDISNEAKTQPSKSSGSTTGQVANPKTGDAGIAGYAVLAVAAAAGLLLLLRRKASS